MLVVLGMMGRSPFGGQTWLYLNWLRGFHRLDVILDRIIQYLRDNAARAHPQRDRRTGRLRFGLEYVGVKA